MKDIEKLLTAAIQQRTGADREEGEKRMRRVTLAATFAAATLAGCINHPGRSVRYVNNDAARFASCTRLQGTIERTAQTIDIARIYARDDAFEAHATHINIINVEHGGLPNIPNVTVYAEAYKCPTDVGGLQ